MDDPVFDHDADFAEKREFEGRRTLLQGGHEFTLRHLYIGPDPTWTEPVVEVAPAPARIEVPEDTGRAGVLARAHQKLAGFSDPEAMSDANKENSRALAAERLAG